MCVSVFGVQRDDNIKLLDDDVTISVSISKKCLISVNIVLVSDRFEKNWYRPSLDSFVYFGGRGQC